MSEQVETQIKRICCYKCTAQKQLLVEEKRDNQGRLLEKNFICVSCAGGFERIFKETL